LVQSELIVQTYFEKTCKTIVFSIAYMGKKVKASFLFHVSILPTHRMASPTILSKIQFSNTRRTPIPRRTRNFAILQIRPDATPHTAWPRNPFYKEINSSGCSGRPHGNDLSDWAFRLHCIPEAYIHTLMGCDAPETPNITDRFLCGLPSTKHSFLIPALASVRLIT
jgi:hypothetical protein